MEMNIFAEKVCVAVKKELGNGYKVEVKKVRKNNGTCRTGLMVLEGGRNVAPTIYLESFLAAYESGMVFSGIISGIVQSYQKSAGKNNIDMEFFRHFGMVRDRVCYRLVGKEGNEALLEEIPHMEFLDLAICFYYAYHGEGIGDGNILIYNSHVEMWDTCTEELSRLAQVNTPRLLPWVLGTLPELLDAQDVDAGMEDGLEIPMRILTNSKKIYGAASILYPGVLEEAAERVGGDYYIFPSSLHEVILMPCDGMLSEEYMKTIISEINNTQVPPEEVLSNSLYRYDSRKKKIELV